MTQVAPRMGAFRVKICEIDEISVFKCTLGLRQDSASAELESARSRFRRIVPADLIPTKHLAAGGPHPGTNHARRMAPTHAERLNPGNVIGSKRAVL